MAADPHYPQPPPNDPRGWTGQPAGGEPPPDDAELPKRSVSTGQILAGLLLVLVVVFVLENTRSVKVRLIVPEVTAPLALPIVIAAVLGALVAWLLRLRRRRRHPGARTR
jgi:uncharacterized integral membrane protein